MTLIDGRPNGSRTDHTGKHYLDLGPPEEVIPEPEITLKKPWESNALALDPRAYSALVGHPRTFVYERCKEALKGFRPEDITKDTAWMIVEYALGTLNPKPTPLTRVVIRRTKAQQRELDRLHAVALEKDARRDRRESPIVKARAAHIEWLDRISCPEEPSYVYRLFNADDELLYIGSTSKLRDRLKAHYKEKEWVREEVEYVKVETYDRRTDAYAIEGMAITTENPKYNKHGKKLVWTDKED